MAGRKKGVFEVFFFLHPVDGHKRKQMKEKERKRKRKNENTSALHVVFCLLPMHVLRHCGNGWRHIRLELQQA